MLFVSISTLGCQHITTEMHPECTAWFLQGSSAGTVLLQLKTSDERRHDTIFNGPNKGEKKHSWIKYCSMMVSYSPDRLPSPHLVQTSQERYTTISCPSLYSLLPPGDRLSPRLSSPTENPPSSTCDTSLSLPSSLNKYACQGLSSWGSFSVLTMGKKAISSCY